MICGYRPKEENVHLRFGSEVHRSYQDYDKLRAEGIKHDEAVFHVVKGLIYRTEDFDSEHKYKNRESLVRTVIWYLEQHEHDPAKVVLRPDGRPMVELSFKFNLDWGPFDSGDPYMLCGHLDKVVDFNSEVFTMDHKSTTFSLTDHYFDGYEPDNQMSLYTWAGKVIYNMPVIGVIINAAQIKVNETEFARSITYRTQSQLDEWIDDLKPHLRKVKEAAEENHWPMNDKACGLYGGCKFRKVCNKSPEVRPEFLKTYYEKGEIWNPLRVRE
jgi:hypothetical protein